MLGHCLFQTGFRDDIGHVQIRRVRVSVHPRVLEMLQVRDQRLFLLGENVRDVRPDVPQRTFAELLGLRPDRSLNHPLQIVHRVRLRGFRELDGEALLEVGPELIAQDGVVGLLKQELVLDVGPFAFVTEPLLGDFIDLEVRVEAGRVVLETVL